MEPDTFEMLANSDSEHVLRLMSRLHPQLTTLILSQMSSVGAARVMDMLNPDMHCEIITRMAALETVDKRVIDFLRKQIAPYIRNYDEQIDGLFHIGNILNKSENAKLVNDSLSCIERDDPEIAISVSNSMRRSV